MKRRFPALKYGIRLQLKNILPVIVSTVVINNIALIAGDEEPPSDELLEAFIGRMRQEGLPVDYDPIEVGPPMAQVGAAANSMRQTVIDSHFA